MKKKGYILFISTLLAISANVCPQTAESDTAIYVPDVWEVSLDSLLKVWHIQHLNQKMEHPAYQQATETSDSVYIDRLSRLNNIIPMHFDEDVRRYINMYVNGTKIPYILGIENRYFPIIEQTLDANGLPEELKYLAIVESALNPAAVSRMGASGLWQFMYGTGKLYGLEINSLIDERRDPILSTQAACRYMKSLYGIYHDWLLVLAAYNSGPGTVNKAIRRAGGQNNYWKIQAYLPKETRAYVPLFIAATYVMNYYAYHQIYPVDTGDPMPTDTVMVSQAIHFEQIAAVLNIDLSLIQSLNPQYKCDIVPGNTKPRPIRLPVLQVYAFVEKETEIANYKKDELFAKYATTVSLPNGSKEKIIHKVVKGDTFRKLESKYGVSMAQIKKWNNLKSNTLVIGRKLTIYLDNGGFSVAK